MRQGGGWEGRRRSGNLSGPGSHPSRLHAGQEGLTVAATAVKHSLVSKAQASSYLTPTST